MNSRNGPPGVKSARHPSPERPVLGAAEPAERRPYGDRDACDRGALAAILRRDRRASASCGSILSDGLLSVVEVGDDPGGVVSHGRRVGAVGAHSVPSGDGGPVRKIHGPIWRAMHLDVLGDWLARKTCGSDRRRELIAACRQAQREYE